MCGIAGIHEPPSRFDPSAAELILQRAAAALAHRGPDASGIKILREHGLAFAHRRLAILDLDPRANQPMVSPDGRILLTFNGEIYNFRELRRELEARGRSFHTESDSEVLIEGYRAWGMEGLLPRLAGMFAFAIYDSDTRRIFLARDRAGKKPLFYREDEHGLRFCSELKSLLLLCPGAAELDPEGLDAYLALKFAPSPRTLFKGVNKVPPGFYLSWSSAGASELVRYWQPFPSAMPTFSPEALSAELDARLTTAMRRRLVSDVPICFFLSGGIDSSLMASYLARMGVRGMTAYTIGYADLPQYNEFEYSRLVAKSHPIQYKETVMESRQVLELLRDESLVLDEPISDWVWIPLYHLSRIAHEDGFKVVLVGEGSDEIFFGYDVMMKGLKDISRFQKPLWKGLARALAPALAPIYQRTRKGHRNYDLLRRAGQGGPIYMGSSIGFGKSQRHQVAGQRLLETGSPDAGEMFISSLCRDYARFSPRRDDSVNLISYIEFYSKMGEVLLSRVDRMTMLHSLEARSPYLDHELVELAFSLTRQQKIAGGELKAALKVLARRTLPPEIVERKKMGFSFPFKEWLRGDLGSLVEDAFHSSGLFNDGWVNRDFCLGLLREHRAGWFDHAPRIWMLFGLCRWYDRWIAR